jgi:hypothetical protein
MLNRDSPCFTVCSSGVAGLGAGFISRIGGCRGVTGGRAGVADFRVAGFTTKIFWQISILSGAVMAFHLISEARGTLYWREIAMSVSLGCTI